MMKKKEPIVIKGPLVIESGKPVPKAIADVCGLPFTSTPIVEVEVKVKDNPQKPKSVTVKLKTKDKVKKKDTTKKEVIDDGSGSR